MPDRARVHSIDAVEAYSQALAAFSDETTSLLGELGMSLNRAVQWIEHDQPTHWKEQYQRAERDVEEARLNLERKKMFRIGDYEPSCHEEEQILAAAKRRRQRARDKLEACRRWGRQLEQQAMEYKGALAPLASWLAVELPKGRAVLKRLRQALSAYVTAQPPEFGAGPPSQAETTDPSQEASSAAPASPETAKET